MSNIFNTIDFAGKPARLVYILISLIGVAVSGFVFNNDGSLLYFSTTVAYLFCVFQTFPIKTANPNLAKYRRLFLGASFFTWLAWVYAVYFNPNLRGIVLMVALSLQTYLLITFWADVKPEGILDLSQEEPK